MACEDAGCSGLLRWQSGKEYQFPANGYNFKRRSNQDDIKVKMTGYANHACVLYRPPYNDFVDALCTAGNTFFCEFDCEGNGATGWRINRSFC